MDAWDLGLLELVNGSDAVRDEINSLRRKPRTWDMAQTAPSDDNDDDGPREYCYVPVK